MEIRSILQQLQKLDLELDALQESLRRLDSGPASDMAAELKGIRSRHSSVMRSVTAARLEAKRFELEVAGADAQIRSIESKLYGGSSGARELTQLQAKLEESKQARTRMEDQLLDLMCRIEAEEGQASQLEAASKELESALAAERESNEVERSQAETAVRRLGAQRTELIGQIGPVIAARYERIRSSSHGLAVAVLQGDCCSGCRVALPEDFVAKVTRKGDTLYTCENCGRILV